MDCKKTLRLIPLLVGEDLHATKASRVNAHLNECPSCRREYEHYRNSLKKTRNWIRSETTEWEDKEWADCIKKAVNSHSFKTRIFIPLSFKPAWAVGVMVIMAIALSVFIMNPSFIKKVSQASRSPALQSEGSQKAVELTLVSQETGHKIKWILNKEFNLEEEIK
jgi:anti-sigma factor RsiW